MTYPVFTSSVVTLGIFAESSLGDCIHCHVPPGRTLQLVILSLTVLHAVDGVLQGPLRPAGLPLQIWQSAAHTPQLTLATWIWATCAILVPLLLRLPALLGPPTPLLPAGEAVLSLLPLCPQG